MRAIPIIAVILIPLSAVAADQRIYQRESQGNIQYDKPSWTVGKDGRIVEMDSVGRRQPHKQQYQIKGDKIYQTDSVGRIQSNKPSYTVRKDGRIVETDSVGREQPHKQQYQIKGDKIYQTDSVGRIQSNKPSYEVKSSKK